MLEGWNVEGSSLALALASASAFYLSNSTIQQFNNLTIQQFEQFEQFEYFNR